MKVTFVVYNHVTGSMDLVHRRMSGNKPSEAEWEKLAEEAKRVMANQHTVPEYNLSISCVMKGWAVFENRAPVGLR